MNIKMYKVKLAGWRIIAVCPQPDSRRPDYIMGRFNPNDDFDKDSANRGR